MAARSQVHPAPDEAISPVRIASDAFSQANSTAHQVDSAEAAAVVAPQLIMRGQMSEYGDCHSTVGEEEDISREQLQMIKARTMFQMTEEIAEDGYGGRKQLLFLTNSQAALLAGSGASLQKILDALEIPKPKLVINLLTSQGFTDFCAAAAVEDLAADVEDAGLVHGRGSFLTPEDECVALDKLDHFMADVILPMAVQTEAIIICNAIPSVCVLSGSLTRMMSVYRSNWGRVVPFTVIYVSGSVPKLYQNPESTAVWRSIRRCGDCATASCLNLFGLSLATRYLPIVVI
jgi:hypothetical protein